MAISAGQKIKISEVIAEFTQQVTDKVMSGALHSKYTIYSLHGIPVVPLSILGNKDKIPTVNPGAVNSRMNANTTYNAMINVVRYLLRVGTYDYAEYLSVTGSWPAAIGGKPSSLDWSSKGKALFSDEYAASQIGNLSTAAISPMPTQSPVLSTHIISADELKALINRCYTSWYNSKRPNYTNREFYPYCHQVCHAYCHSSCHNSCHSNDPCDNKGECNTGRCYVNGAWWAH